MFRRPSLGTSTLAEGDADAAAPTVSNLRRAALVALVVATAIALIWKIWPDPTSPAAVKVPAQTIIPGTVIQSRVCGDPGAGVFRPMRISIAHVADNAQILALGRDANNVPEAPALSSLGKTQFAWDDPRQQSKSIVDPIKPPGAMPGSDRGHVLMNAHTWPDDSALGNRLLDHLQPGGQIVLHGRHTELCYRVTKRIVVLASKGSAEYYNQSGPPELALIVCSPPRLGPGNWAHRTIWFASPITA